MALSKSAKYYRENPQSRRVKAKKDKEINSRPEQKAKRAELGRINRKADARGVDRKGKDWDHAVNKYVSVKTNRGRKNEGARKKK